MWVSDGAAWSRRIATQANARGEPGTEEPEDVPGPRSRALNKSWGAGLVSGSLVSSKASSGESPKIDGRVGEGTQS